MNTTDQIHFYSSKPRLIHMAANIWIAPAYLYLIGIWTWPQNLHLPDNLYAARSAPGQ